MHFVQDPVGITLYMSYPHEMRCVKADFARENSVEAEARHINDLGRGTCFNVACAQCLIGGRDGRANAVVDTFESHGGITRAQWDWRARTSESET